MRPTITTIAVATVLALSAVLVLPLAASAHGDVSQGKLDMTIGFATEPAFAGQPNGAQITILRKGKPVNDIGDSLHVTIAFGGQTSEPLALDPAFFYEDGKLESGTPGQYRADFVPSAPGKYTFHFQGTVHGDKVDQTMSSGPETFSEVEDPIEAAFPPVSAPTNQELADLLQRGTARTDAAIASANDAASTAKTVAYVGVALGAIGIIAGIAALAASRRRS